LLARSVARCGCDVRWCGVGHGPMAAWAGAERRQSADGWIAGCVVKPSLARWVDGRTAGHQARGRAGGGGETARRRWTWTGWDAGRCVQATQVPIPSRHSLPYQVQRTLSLVEAREFMYELVEVRRYRPLFLSAQVAAYRILCLQW
jgi:hypothetical protein